MQNDLYNRRKELGLTLEQVGEICGVGKSTVRKWENGIINNMGRDKIIALSKALQVSPLFILQAESAEPLLTKYEKTLLNYTSKLNDIGKRKVLDYAQDLVNTTIYTNDTMHETMMVAENSNIYSVNAAHEIPEATKEDKKHDDDIMYDDNEWK